MASYDIGACIYLLPMQLAVLEIDTNQWQTWYFGWVQAAYKRGRATEGHS